MVLLRMRQTTTRQDEKRMDFAEIYHFLFETYVGIGVLVGISLVLCVIIAFLLEMRTRKTYVDRGERGEDDEWSIFDDTNDEDSE